MSDDPCDRQAAGLVRIARRPENGDYAAFVLDGWTVGCSGVRTVAERNVADIRSELAAQLRAAEARGYARGVEAAARVLDARAKDARTRARQHRDDNAIVALERADTEAWALKDAAAAIRALPTEGGPR